MSLNLNITIRCHLDGSMGGYVVVMDGMSPDYGTVMQSQWKMNIMEVSNDDL